MGKSGEYDFMSILTDFVVSMISNKIGDEISKLGKQKEYREFKNELINDLEKFIQQNEATIIAKDDFSNYISLHNVIAEVIDYVKNPIGESENIFLTKLANKINKSLSEQKMLVHNDKAAIKEFLCLIINKTKNFYTGMLPSQFTILRYDINQIGSESDKLHIHSSGDKDERMVVKKQYDEIPDIINRMVMPYQYVQEGPIGVCFHSKDKIDLMELCLKEKRIILLGEAGCGKSISLKQVASKLSKLDYYPLVINLCNYTNDDIRAIVSDNYEDIDKSKLFLIFDGYDEIGEISRDVFARKLNYFAELYKEAIILISTRTNFYKFANKNGSGSTFSGFKEYGICPITNYEIKEYVNSQGLDYTVFNKEVQNKKLTDMLMNPFYLSELIKLIKIHGDLPLKSKVMYEIIKSRFQADEDKYATSRDIENEEHDLMLKLREVAFAIQCIQKVSLSNQQYQELFSSEERTLLRYSGVFHKNGENYWTFDHNNFREYLAAEYLNNLDFDNIKTIICCGLNNRVIRNSWVNVLSFLILIYDSDYLLDWLQKDHLSYVVKFERSRVEENIRDEIFINIFNSYTEKNISISCDINSENDLAEFGESIGTLNFLLSQIDSPAHFRCQSNAVHL